MARTEPADLTTDPVTIEELPERVRQVARAYHDRDEKATREALSELARDAWFLAARDPLRWPHQPRTVEHRQDVMLDSTPVSFIA
jgi:hypothetical protein